MKKSLMVIIVIVVAILGFLVAYSLTGLPEGAFQPAEHAEKGAASGGYGAAIMEPKMETADVIPPGANPQLLVTPEEVAQNSRNWIVLDCRSKGRYDKSHIPGAISLGGRCHVLIRDTEKIAHAVGKMKDDYDSDAIKKAFNSGKISLDDLLASLALRPAGDIAKMFGDAGITTDRTVVIYSDAKDMLPGYHAVPFFALEYLGHPDVRILDGGFKAWLAQGRPVAREESKLLSATFNAKVNESILATGDEVLKIAKGEAGDVQLVDARLKPEYLGKVIAPAGHFLAAAAKRKGRIPNTTVNIPHFQQFASTKTLKMRPMKQLEGLYTYYGKLDKSKRTVLYCYIANRIAFSYFTLRLLGFEDPAIYHDSYIVWSNDNDKPVAN